MSQAQVTDLATRADVPIRDGVLAPANMEGLWRVAAVVARSGLVPTGMESPERCFLALAKGAEIGLSPMQSIESIAPINGKATIYGDAALALVRASGELVEFEERLEGAGDDRVAYCRSVREDARGRTFSVETSFSLQEAKDAGLFPGRNRKGEIDARSPWNSYTNRMLKFRARGFNLRDNFGDVLKGMVTFEEARDYQHIEQPRGAGAGDALPEEGEFGFDEPKKPEPSKPVEAEFEVIDARNDDDEGGERGGELPHEEDGSTHESEGGEPQGDSPPAEAPGPTTTGAGPATEETPREGGQLFESWSPPKLTGVPEKMAKALNDCARAWIERRPAGSPGTKEHVAKRAVLAFLGDVHGLKDPEHYADTRNYLSICQGLTQISTGEIEHGGTKLLYSKYERMATGVGGEGG